MILRRLLESLLVIFLGISLAFFIVHLAPGSPADRYFRPGIDAETQTVLQQRFGLDQPLFIQYLKWLNRLVLHGDFGYSVQSGIPAMHLVRAALPASILVVGSALILALVSGIFLGIQAAVRAGSVFDRLTTGVMFFFNALPVYWLGLLVLSIGAIRLHWFPAALLESPFHDQLDCGARVVDYIRHLVLPVITLGLPMSAVFYRYMRTSMVNALNADYIIAARAHGITNRRIVYDYAFRNCLLPQITLIGTSWPLLFSGAVLVEVIFTIPGMGRLMLEAAQARDYPVILATSVIALMAVVGGNLMADLLYRFADPRLRPAR